MPATSKQQYKFMKGVAAGSIKAPGLSKKKASEYVQGQKPDNLPAKKTANSKKKSKS